DTRAPPATVRPVLHLPAPRFQTPQFADRLYRLSALTSNALTCEKRALGVRPTRSVGLRVVLAQQILAVVVAVRGSDHRMNVGARRPVVLEVDAPLVIELDQDHRALHPVVKRARLVA